MKSRILVVVLSLVGLVLIAIALRATRPDIGDSDGGDADPDALAETSVSDADLDSAIDAGDDTSVDAQVDAPVDAGLPTACSALADDNDAKLSAIDAGKDCVKPPEVDCVTTSADITWGYRIKRATAKDDNPVPKGNADWDQNRCSSKVDLELVRKDLDGGVRAIPGAVTLEYSWLTDENRISLVALSDYDGDGEVELLRMTDVYLHESAKRHASHVLTFKSGNLSPYSAAPNAIVLSAKDIDGDGRMDLITRGPFASVAMKNINGSDLLMAPAIFAAHSLKDGTFSSTDDASKAFTQQSCPSKPTLDLKDAKDSSKLDDLALEVVCARVWGLTEQEIVAEWKKTCGDGDGGDPISCQSWPKKMAAISPPFTLH